MKTKAQKKQEIEDGVVLAKDAVSMVFVDFAKTPVKNITELKNEVRTIGGVYRVIKKRLLQRAFTEQGVSVDTKGFGGQLATVFSPKDISEAGGIVYRFSRGFGKGSAFKILGGYDLKSKTYFSDSEMQRIGQLPSRDILLAQLLGMLQAPVKSLVYTLDQIAKQK
ncbi:MAG: 50S ribosomal protein L10 [Candidatus Paceibacterota bacterium]